MELAFSLGGALGRGGSSFGLHLELSCSILKCSGRLLTTTPGMPHSPGCSSLTPFIRLMGRSRDTISFASNFLAILSSFPAECETMIIVRGQRNVPGVPTPAYFKPLLSDCLSFCVKITINLSTRELSSNKYSFSHRPEKEM